jgi:hypothetical protein
MPFVVLLKRYLLLRKRENPNGCEIVRHTQRIHPVLEEANIKLASVITDILGYSGRRMLKAIVAGETDARRLADLGSSRLAAPREALLAALDGRIRDHHRFLIGQHLKTIEQVEATIGEFDARVEAARGYRMADQTPCSPETMRALARQRRPTN